jgi:hypothetical protein
LCRTALAGAACAFGLLVLFLLDHALNIETIRFAGFLPQLTSRAPRAMLTMLTLLSVERHMTDRHGLGVPGAGGARG